MSNIALSQPQEMASVANFSAQVSEIVLATGDLGKLNSQQRQEYYLAVCQACGVDYRTRPFEFLVLQGKTVLYARKDCTEQLRARNRLSCEIVSSVRVDDVYVVRVRISDGRRTDEATGAVTVGNAKGDALANALMKAETKAKRRATLSFCGLGILDETEIETISGTPSETEAVTVKQLWDVGSRVFAGDKNKMKVWLESRGQSAASVQKLQPAALAVLLAELESTERLVRVEVE